MARSETRLSEYKILALRYQDEAYTLAYYLLGDEQQAEETIQAAFGRLFQQGNAPVGRFRLEALRGVLLYVRRSHVVLSLVADPDPLIQQLTRLGMAQRSAIVLVDVLGLDYEEAGQVLGVSKKQAGRLVAQGRLALRPQLSHAPHPL
jgi:DNA-directed RNA polymerase specialized sigma24 family protein